ncbi:MAG TPA: glutamate--tRNA ligase, partial [Rickettsiales bacterium]|nr:glutamate--tRNA ligase [Rickettsiales bacterium]
KEVAQELLAQNKAYYCYTSTSELDELRKAAEKNGEVFRFKSQWREKNREPIGDEKPVIRIKAPQIGEIVIKDAVQGEVRVQCEEIDDLVLLRGDGTPTYMFAVVVDDCDMKITHIIRGDDHFTNTFRQKVIYDALEKEVPQFAHIPLIHGSDGAKMSKRHGATSVIEYRQMGYLPEALRNYLLRLGWSHGDDEIISDMQAIEWFDLDHIGKSPSRFDFAKLDNLNKHYIKQKSEAELLAMILEFFVQKPNQKEALRITKSLKFTKEKVANLQELAQISQIYFDNQKGNFDAKAQQNLVQNQQKLTEIRDLLAVLEDWNHDSIKTALQQYLDKNSLKMKDLGPSLRLALTFSESSGGGIFDVIEILGKEEVLARIDKALQL